MVSSMQYPERIVLVQVPGPTDITYRQCQEAIKSLKKNISKKSKFHQTRRLGMRDLVGYGKKQCRAKNPRFLNRSINETIAQIL